MKERIKRGIIAREGKFHIIQAMAMIVIIWFNDSSF
jgi:hypothetical protein